MDPADFEVRDLEQEIPASDGTGRVKRLRRTRSIIEDALTRNAPFLVIQPQFLIPTRPGPRPYFFVAPDFMVWLPDRGVFMPGDAKSFVVRDNEVDPSDLERTRLQLASQILGLRHEFAQIDPGRRIKPEGLLICATPYALKPHPPTIEDLSGAVRQVHRAIDKFVEHREKIIRVSAGAPEHLIVDQLQPSFREKCVSTCAMSDYCRSRHGTSPAELGDAAARLLGANQDLDRLISLMNGSAVPTDDAERDLANELRRTASEIDPARRAA